MPSFRIGMPFIAAVLGFCSFAGLADAQSVSSTINGLVVDNTGGLVVGAQVTITNQGTGVKVESRTNSQGDFSMTGLPSGTYEVSVTREGLT